MIARENFESDPRSDVPHERWCHRCDDVGTAYKTEGRIRYYKCKDARCKATWKVIFRPAEVLGRTNEN